MTVMAVGDIEGGTGLWDIRKACRSLKKGPALIVCTYGRVDGGMPNGWKLINTTLVFYNASPRLHPPVQYLV